MSHSALTEYGDAGGSHPSGPGRRDGAGAVRRTGLIRAEIHRFVSRRFIRWLFGLSVLAFAVIVPLIAITQFSRTTAEVRAQAQQEIDRLLAEQQTYYEACLKQPVPSDVGGNPTVQEYCGQPANPADYRVEDFLPKRPFALAEYLQPGALAVGVATAALLFVIGATWVGAEWSARTMMALLFWETRRLRVLSAKLAVLAVVAALVGVVAQAVWAGSAYAIGSTRGTTTPLPKGFWGDVVELGGRCTLLGLLTALIGFAVAHLIRSTGAALGIGFVYFAILENAVGAVRPAWREWLLSTNAIALIVKGGLPLTVPGTTVDPQNGQVLEYREVLLTNLHGGLVFGGVTAVLLVIGAWLYRRRDLT